MKKLLSFLFLLGMLFAFQSRLHAAPKFPAIGIGSPTWEIAFPGIGIGLTYGFLVNFINNLA